MRLLQGLPGFLVMPLGLQGFIRVAGDATRVTGVIRVAGGATRLLMMLLGLLGLLMMLLGLLGLLGLRGTMRVCWSVAMAPGGAVRAAGGAARVTGVY